MYLQVSPSFTARIVEEAFITSFYNHPRTSTMNSLREIIEGRVWGTLRNGSTLIFPVFGGKETINTLLRRTKQRDNERGRIGPLSRQFISRR